MHARAIRARAAGRRPGARRAKYWPAIAPCNWTLLAGRFGPNVAAMTATIDTVSVPVRLDVDAHIPAFAKAMSHLDRTSVKELDRVEFDAGLRELVRVRASQLNGCAYCVDTHTKDARAAGESEQRVNAVAIWRESPFFTARERAALA